MAIRLPVEQQRLVVVLTGPRALPGLAGRRSSEHMDFYDLKGVIHALLEGLHLPNVRYVPVEHPTYHPGKGACVMVGEMEAGMIGELHPLVRQNYELPAASLLAADLDLDSLLAAIPPRFDVAVVPAFPPVLEDLALVVDEAIPAERVEETIRQAGGDTLAGVRLFDVYRGEQIGRGVEKPGVQPDLPGIRPHPDRSGIGTNPPTHFAPLAAGAQRPATQLIGANGCSVGINGRSNAFVKETERRGRCKNAERLMHSHLLLM